MTASTFGHPSLFSDSRSPGIETGSKLGRVAQLFNVLRARLSRTFQQPSVGSKVAQRRKDKESAYKSNNEHSSLNQNLVLLIQSNDPEVIFLCFQELYDKICAAHDAVSARAWFLETFDLGLIPVVGKKSFIEMISQCERVCAGGTSDNYGKFELLVIDFCEILGIRSINFPEQPASGTRLHQIDYPKKRI